MARTEEVFSIFLASPGDVAEERNRLAEFVSRWNTTWGRHQGVRLELIRWEDDAYPGIGLDAQDVINNQIPQDYDLFVGIMWSRFGTPTDRSGSGTEEEFFRALERYKLDTSSINILFYFKDTPIPPSKINADQISKVIQFKEKLRSIGLLTWDFSDTDDFEKLVQLHVTRYLQNRKPKTATESINNLAYTNSSEQPTIPSKNDDYEESQDYGYLDSIEEFSAHSENISEIVEKITAAQVELAEKITAITSEISSYRRSDTVISHGNFRNTIARAAEEMTKHSDLVDTEIPQFHLSMEGSMRSLVKVITVTAELYPDKIEPARKQAVLLLENLIKARSSIEEYRDVTAELPRLTKELNYGKRRLVAALQKFIDEIANGENLLKQSISIINELQAQ
ncbi:MAG: DUF4062 domain-containing protein [Pseudomonadota bacterium]